CGGTKRRVSSFCCSMPSLTTTAWEWDVPRAVAADGDHGPGGTGTIIKGLGVGVGIGKATGGGKGGLCIFRPSVTPSLSAMIAGSGVIVEKYEGVAELPRFLRSFSNPVQVK